MKHSFVLVFTLAAASGALIAVACSSSSDSGTTGTTVDSGTSGTNTSGAPATSGAPSTSGTDGRLKDTCTSNTTDNTCQCACGLTGQTENTTLHCPQPAADTGQCAKLCCTGPIDASASGSSGTSGTSGMSSGSLDASGD